MKKAIVWKMQSRSKPPTPPTDEWWPAPLAHVAKEDPWSSDPVIVAEIRSFDEQPHPGHRTTFSALVPIDQLDEVKKALAKFSHEVEASGPHPFADGPYTPKFWVEFTDANRRKFEPLALTWRSHDKTVLQIDPGFLMTYGLSPRTVDGTVVWDDPAAPAYDVARVTPPSTWDFPLHTRAFAAISKEYLQDYLTLRRMALVQIFYEIRRGNIDDEIEKKLGANEGANVDFPDRKFQLSRDIRAGNIVVAQVWGARVIANPGALPISENSLENEGLVWPGFDEAITDNIAMSLGVADEVYVDDRVLGHYEGRPEYQINPASGSVTFGTQWSVGFCNRAGRNLIRVELKKLYEGVPPHVTRHWQKFSVPKPDDEYANAMDVASRTEDLVNEFISLSEALASLAQSVGTHDRPEDFVSLRKEALDYHGWWTFDEIEPISRHIPLDFTVDACLDRSVALTKLIVEGLSESALRRTLLALGVPSDAIKTLRTLKLLNCLVRMAQVGIASGLKLSSDGTAIWERLEADGTTPDEPIAHLFALYDLRLLQSHRAGDRGTKLAEALSRFGVGADEGAAGYGIVADKIYDAVIAALTSAREKIEQAL